MGQVDGDSASGTSGLVGCIVVGAGRGLRLGVGPKALVLLHGTTLLHRACAAAAAGGADEVVAVVPPDRPPPVDLPAGVRTVPGRSSRQESVAAGLAALGPDVTVVLVHDAARALAPPSVFADVVVAVRSGAPAVVPGVPVVDTLRRLDPAIGGAVDRDQLVAVQTPQGFDRATLELAHASPVPGPAATDDAGLVERAGTAVRVVPGHEDAFKVTRPLDLLLADAVLRQRMSQPAEAAAQ